MGLVIIFIIILAFAGLRKGINEGAQFTKPYAKNGLFKVLIIIGILIALMSSGKGK